MWHSNHWPQGRGLHVGLSPTPPHPTPPPHPAPTPPPPLGLPFHFLRTASSFSYVLLIFRPRCEISSRSALFSFHSFVALTYISDCVLLLFVLVFLRFQYLYIYTVYIYIYSVSCLHFLVNMADSFSFSSAFSFASLSMYTTLSLSLCINSCYFSYFYVLLLHSHILQRTCLPLRVLFTTYYLSMQLALPLILFSLSLSLNVASISLSYNNIYAERLLNMKIGFLL